MDNFKTLKRLTTILKEDGYKFKYKYNNGKSIYWDYYGNVAEVDFNLKTVEYKGMI